MRLLCLSGSIAIFVLAPLSAAAQPISPTGPWKLSADAESCALQREFGEGEDTLALELRRFFPGDMRAVLSSRDLRPSKSKTIRYRLNDGEEWRIGDAKYNLAAPTGGSVVFFPWAFLLPEAHNISDPTLLKEFLQRRDLATVEKAAGARVDILTLEDAFENPVSLEVGSLAEPIEMMNDCLDDVVSGWNIDAEVDKTLIRPAAPTEATSEWLTTFPPISDLFHQARPNDLTIRLMISASGAIEACNFYKIGGDPRAAELSCESLRRNARFEPAFNKDGRSIKSFFVYRLIDPNEKSGPE